MDKHKLMYAKEIVPEYCYYQCNAITFVILFVYYVVFIMLHIKRRTTIKPLKAGKNEQNTDVT